MSGYGFVRFEGQAMPLFHFYPGQLKVRCRPAAGMVIPPIRKQDATDIDEKAFDSGRLRHRCQTILASSSGIATPS